MAGSAKGGTATSKCVRFTTTTRTAAKNTDTLTFARSDRSCGETDAPLSSTSSEAHGKSTASVGAQPDDPPTTAALSPWKPRLAGEADESFRKAAEAPDSPRATRIHRSVKRRRTATTGISSPAAADVLAVSESKAKLMSTGVGTPTRNSSPAYGTVAVAVTERVAASVAVCVAVRGGDTDAVSVTDPLALFVTVAVAGTVADRVAAESVWLSVAL